MINIKHLFKKHEHKPSQNGHEKMNGTRKLDIPSTSTLMQMISQEASALSDSIDSINRNNEKLLHVIEDREEHQHNTGD